MPTSRHLEYAVREDYAHSVEGLARLYVARLWALDDARAKVEETRRDLVAAVERER